MSEPTIDEEVAAFMAYVMKQKLPPNRARRRCLGCWSWNPPQTHRCLRCDAKILPFPEDLNG